MVEATALTGALTRPGMGGVTTGLRLAACVACLACFACLACQSSERPTTAAPSATSSGGSASDPDLAFPSERRGSKLRQGEAHLAAGRLDEAEAAFRGAIAERPQDARAHFDLGLTLELRGRSADAAQSYRRAISRAPAFAEALSNLGRLLRVSGRLEEATELFRRAVRANPELVSAHLNLALALEDAEKWRLARAAYREVLRLEPTQVRGRILLGLLHLRMGEVEDARSALRAAFEQGTEDRALLSMLGSGLRRAGESALAVRALESVSSMPGNRLLSAEAELALALFAAGRRAEAESRLRGLLESTETYPVAHYLLANMLAARGAARSAAQHFANYLQQAPEGEHASEARRRLRAVRAAAQRGPGE